MIVIVVACLLLAGCSATSVEVGQSPTPRIVTTPSTGESLASLGFENGCASMVWLPSGTQLTYTADQPNLVIVAGQTSQAPQVEEYLRRTLPMLGWTITASGDGGLMFTQGEWHGAYALGGDSWALTVRND